MTEKPVSAANQRSPREISEEIDQTREEMGDTVAAVAEKTDVKAQAQAKVEDVKEQAQALARQNPKPVAIAGAVLGLFLAWRLLKS